MQQHLALFGGSFDPVHAGHVALVRRVLEAFSFTAVHLIPCGQQVLKGPHHANRVQRLTMLQLAFSGLPKVSINEIELQQSAPSYTIHTLQAFRKRLDKTDGLTFILGEDAFWNMGAWLKPKDIIKHANLLVLGRGATRLDKGCNFTAELLTQHEVHSIEALMQSPAGAILRYHAGDFPWSSTLIREKILHHEDVEAYLPKTVLAYIKDQQLYA